MKFAKMILVLLVVLFLASTAFAEQNWADAAGLPQPGQPFVTKTPAAQPAKSGRQKRQKQPKVQQPQVNPGDQPWAANIDPNPNNNAHALPNVGPGTQKKQRPLPAALPMPGSRELVMDLEYAGPMGRVERRNIEIDLPAPGERTAETLIDINSKYMYSVQVTPRRTQTDKTGLRFKTQLALAVTVQEKVNNPFKEAGVCKNQLLEDIKKLEAMVADGKASEQTKQLLNNLKTDPTLADIKNLDKLFPIRGKARVRPCIPRAKPIGGDQGNGQVNTIINSTDDMGNWSEKITDATGNTFWFNIKRKE